MLPNNSGVRIRINGMSNEEYYMLINNVGVPITGNIEDNYNVWVANCLRAYGMPATWTFEKFRFIFENFKTI